MNIYIPYTSRTEVILHDKFYAIYVHYTNFNYRLLFDITVIVHKIQFLSCLSEQEVLILFKLCFPDSLMNIIMKRLNHILQFLYKILIIYDSKFFFKSLNKYFDKIFKIPSSKFFPSTKESCSKNIIEITSDIDFPPFSSWTFVKYE